MDEPFGRQPKPHSITIEGEYEDIYPLAIKLRRIAASAGDTTQDDVRTPNIIRFTIYPRAVND